MSSFSTEGTQINPACTFFINWKFGIINDYSKWTNNSNGKMTDQCVYIVYPNYL